MPPRRPRPRVEALESRENPAYVSPYAIAGPDPASVGDIGTPTGAGRLHDALVDTTPAYDPAAATNPWYDPQHVGSAYGPFLNQQPQAVLPAGLDGTTAAGTAFYMDRLAATARALVGTAYQHHHDPLWDPYAHGFHDDPAAGDYWSWVGVSDNPTSPIYALAPDPAAPSGYGVVTLATKDNPYRAAYGTGAAGIDCSDLTSLVYNAGIGLYMSTGVGQQGRAGPGGGYNGASSLGWALGADSQPVDYTQKAPAGAVREVAPRFFFGPNSAYHGPGDTYHSGPSAGQPIGPAQRDTRYVTQWNTPDQAGRMAALTDQLQPGDLLYIAGEAGEHSQVTHVVMWLGRYGANADGSPSAVPLVVSSHDNTPPVLDLGRPLSAGEAQALDLARHLPPPGVQVLPFTPDTWFYQNFSHAMRVLPTLTTLSLTSSAPAARSGEAVTFTAAVGSNSGTPTGVVEFAIDGGPPVAAVVNANGVATYTTSFAGTGPHAVAATYVYDGTFAGTTAGLTQAVVVGAPSLTAARQPADPARVDVRAPDGSVRLTLAPYPGHGGRVSVAVGDLDGDGADEVVTGAGPGGGPHVKVFDGRTGAERGGFFAYDPGFRGGVSVAVADVTGDGVADVVTGAGAGEAPHVKVFDGRTGREVRSFYAYDPGFRGGVHVALLDADRDGRPEVITGPGQGGGPVAGVFNARTGVRRAAFLVGPADDRGGVRLAARDLDGDGRPELVARVAGADRVVDPLTGEDRTGQFPTGAAGGAFGD